jgi:hypothetical protein
MRLLPALLAALLPAATIAATAPRGVAQSAGPLGRLAFLAGCWERRGGGRIVEEQWMQPRGRIMLGASRTTRGDSVVEYEHLRIEARGDTIVYHAKPSGQAPADFRLIDAGAGTATFENPSHDFPQRIRYRLAGRDSLVARIEGTVGGRSRAVDFPYARAACPG